MTQETQTSTQQAAPEQQTVQVGFEKALMMMNPEWRTAFTPEQVNSFRHFYHQGIQDINLLNNINFQNAQQNFQAVLQTAIVTGNEEQIAELQRQQAEADAAERDEDEGGLQVIDTSELKREATMPAKKAGKAPAKGAKAAKGKR